MTPDGLRAKWFFPQDLLAQSIAFFSALQPYVVGYGMTEMIKRTLYGVGEPYVFGVIQMLCYVGTELLLMAVGRPWRQRREVRTILACRPTMSADAQRANAERGRHMRDEVLAHYGVASGVDALQADGATSDPFVNYGQSLSIMQNDKEQTPRRDKNNVNHDDKL